jgi:hypothetical protein
MLVPFIRWSAKRIFTVKTRSRCLAVVVIGALGLLTFGTGPAAADIGICPVFPPDHILNTRVDWLPVHPLSNYYVASIGTNTSLHPDFGSGLWDGGPIGIPAIAVLNQPPVPIVFTAYGDQSDPGPYPVPPNAPIEGGAASTGDRHVLTVEQSNCMLYELFNAFGPLGGDNHWKADSGATFNLHDYALRPDTFTSADAAGLPIFPLLVRYDEASAGVIRHAIRFTADTTQTAHVWPARHDAGSTSNAGVPPMGQRFRLKASKDISGFSPRVRAIFQAFKTYGLVLADNGSNWFISGVSDENWNNDELNAAFGQLKGSDFEAVDVSSLLIDPNSGRARQPVFPGGVYVATGRIDASAGAEIITGPGAGGGPEVKVFKADGTLLGPGFTVYPAGFTGGVRVAACDFDGDGRDEIVTGAGPGGGPHVRVLKLDSTGTPIAELASFFPYAPGFAGGVFVACGPIEGPGFMNILTGADAGGGPHVRVFRYSAAAPGGVVDTGISFFAYNPAFTGGVRVAACDLNGDGRADLVLAAGPGGGPHVRALSGANLGVELASFFAYAIGFHGGVFVACGSVLGGPKMVTGADAGGGPHARVFRYSGAAPGGVVDTGISFFAYNPAFTGGVRIAVGDINGDGQGDIVTAAGPGSGPHVRAFTGAGVALPTSFFAY